MIAQGTPAELIASLRAEHVLEFAVADPAALDQSALGTLEGVCGAALRNGLHRLQVSELHRAVPQLLGELRRQGAQLTELRTHSASLEDVFVLLTGEQID